MNRKDYPNLGERVYEATLPNGLLVRVVPKPGFAKTYGFLAVNYGSIDTSFTRNGTRYETPRGVAHYLEHKMFDLPEGNAMQMFSRFGGNPNAFTSYDITAYYMECTEQVKENLELLLHFVSTPYFTQESVEKERGIIAQEIRMYEDSAGSCVYEAMFEAAYAHHPMRYAIAGTVESIQDISAQTLYDCYGAFYTPSNMMLCVVGDVDPQMVLDLAERTLPADRAEAVQRDYGPQEAMEPVRPRVEREMEVSMPTFTLGFKTEPAAFGPDSMAQEVIGDLAAEILVGESSPLYTELYTKNLIDADFSAGYDGMKGAAMLTASGDSEEPERVYEAILKEADRIRRDGVDTALFQRLKKSALGRRMRDLDSFDSICYRMCAYHFEGVDYFDFPAIFQSVTEDQVAEFLSRTVVEPRAALSVIRPHG
ncbi:MAG: EF-P 5-aminopentanol modification-associated protein YfmH [Candidatus Avoscillospira sp.]